MDISSVNNTSAYETYNSLNADQQAGCKELYKSFAENQKALNESIAAIGDPATYNDA
ncbi:MAG TPA: hypothetical protein VJK48_05465 [Chlamydiales bacterium]|nr:hypothetical protein [Chlamydiales bacterium]